MCKQFIDDDIVPLEEQEGFIEVFTEITRDATRKAAQETLDDGRPICIAENGYIVYKYPDGHIERIKKLPALIITEDRYVAEEQPDGTFKKLHKLPDCITVCKR
jgi:hypothetical protein